MDTNQKIIEETFFCIATDAASRLAYAQQDKNLDGIRDCYATYLQSLSIYTSLTGADKTDGHTTQN